MRFIENMGSRGGMTLVDDIMKLGNSVAKCDILEKQQQMGERLAGY